MNKYKYDGKTNSFYPYSLKSEYELAGTWPESGQDVDDAVFKEFSTSPPGKTRIAGDNGLPAWADIPPPTKDELVAEAAVKKSLLIAEASNVIAPLKDASDGGYIDDADKPRLAAWQKYRYALTKVDPANPVWPEKPAE
ncbi:tail fiber assembly protein [Citrobacter sp. Cpo142]|uniref:tail fiber assembly protein n=1 Tax=Citrobacter TaxID=544 RepID=UPI002575BD31|nr:tail fiber assembly protein [Citrobacter sp. Cpo142]MDM2778038.1 tail fiber assembly protein [Citrobacter sp. Cpo142]